MLRQLELEWRLCSQRITFQVLTFLFFMLSIGAFLFVCYRNYGTDLLYVRSAYEMSILQGTSTRIVLTMELMLLPLMTPLIYSDSFTRDIHSGIFKGILTRVEIRTYLVAKAIIIFLVSFLIIFIPLLINQLLCLLAFPKLGFDNRYNLPPYDIGFQNYDSEAILDVLRLESPLLYNVTFMLLISLMGAAFSLFSYGIFLLFNKSRFVVFSGMFLFITIFNLGLSAIVSYRWSFTNLLVPGNPGSLEVLFFWFLVLILGFITALLYTIKKREVGLEK
ncbi:hypothetical protein [Paenibacillus herberti]|uniref:Uncharacterized protein n=1 Tax=Paenibacillus herberti TaxID=1619309 RepID=A0A229P3G3_9BACL|nr:hypothetical protein [Paenibacillus herberti]OXM16591.1 hypothetical protein CGZ75_07995 [Paenibacillus herberti]